jgi:head-tail adaptor
MRAGILNELIDIYEPVEEINEYGERLFTWKLKYTTRASVSWDSGSRNIENSEIVNNYTKTFTVRSYVPVTEKDEIHWQEKKYRIISVEHRKELSFNGILIRTELINE